MYLSRFIFGIILSVMVFSCDRSEESCDDCGQEDWGQPDSSFQEEDSLTDYQKGLDSLMGWRYGPRSSDGHIIAYIEIPAGTNVKYELSKETKELEVEQINGEDRTIDYLPYPANYGFIPLTILDTADGGDGDPLDCIVLGDAVESGIFLECKALGVLQLVDNGEQDDKVLLAPIGSKFAEYDEVEYLDQDYTGLLTIIETWFVNYKGAGQMVSKGFTSSSQAQELINRSSASRIIGRGGRDFSKEGGEELKSDIELR